MRFVSCSASRASHFHHNAITSKTFNFAGITIGAVHQIAIVFTTVLVFLALHLFTTRTRIGIGWRATVSRPQMAASFGVDPIQVRYLNFAIGSALAAVAGGLVALLNNLVDPGIGFVVSYKALAIIVLGGSAVFVARSWQVWFWAWSKPTARSSWARGLTAMR